MSHKLNIVIEKDEYGYYAYVPELEGCQSQGDTLEEVTANIQEAIAVYPDSLPVDDPLLSALSAASAFHS
ncbi:MAG: type II toxin-antitoxin system HicB family antitoxin [Caldilineaceae bacterium]|nr:type II toxin-antitoxin system HicB family antitoxin [Caldilineaceae bacterium]HRJ42128.1 type II toxin-antitoxin system HicB family antitoxin [Caldilineaceae bacterium]